MLILKVAAVTAAVPAVFAAGLASLDWMVVDVREGGFLRQFPRTYRRLQAIPGLKPTLIFLEASHSALVRRFSETRRPHPLAPDRSVIEGITEERGKLNPIRSMASTTPRSMTRCANCARIFPASTGASSTASAPIRPNSCRRSPRPAISPR